MSNLLRCTESLLCASIFHQPQRINIETNKLKLKKKCNSIRRILSELKRWNAMQLIHIQVFNHLSMPYGDSNVSSLDEQIPSLLIKRAMWVQYFVFSYHRRHFYCDYQCDCIDDKMFSIFHRLSSEPNSRILNKTTKSRNTRLVAWSTYVMRKGSNEFMKLRWKRFFILFNSWCCNIVARSKGTRCRPRI